MQQILADIQTQAGPEQAVSARLLPTVAGAEQVVTPVVDEPEDAEDAEVVEKAASAA